MFIEPSHYQRVRVIDSHTGGEPTRLVVGGAPDLRGSTLAEKAVDFRDRFDGFRTSIMLEPRGSDVLVGAMTCPTDATGCQLGVLFFNNVGVLGMCGHGMIGVVRTLAHMGMIQVGRCGIDTPVGPVEVELFDDMRVAVKNVPCFRKAKDVAVAVDAIGTVVGDVAWGGNWFYLVSDHGRSLELANVEALTDYAWRVRKAVNAQGYPEVDHIELFGAASSPMNHSRNFVLCPGKAYDRSPCGTGTSAKVACLAADGKLQPGDVWRQESIVGSLFEASYQWSGDQVIPTIKGQAWICGESELVFDPTDPFRQGIAH